MTTPRPRAVVIGSLSLFVVLFVVLTFELSASANTSKVAPKAKTVKARPAPTESQTDAPEPEAGEYAEPEEAGSEYVEPESEYVEPEPEPEYEEPVYEEPEYVEPEVEEVPPVVTSSS